MVQRGRGMITAAAVIAAASALSACSHFSGPRADTTRTPGQSRDSDVNDHPGIPIPFFGGGGNNNAPAQAQLGVNPLLWRASLDTLNFMPLSSADPVGGVIITDWYSDPRTPNERFKATVYILDTRLRADALNVSVFKQTRSASTAAWSDAAVDPQTPIQIEDAILTRARQLRLSSVESDQH